MPSDLARKQEDLEVTTSRCRSDENERWMFQGVDRCYSLVYLISRLLCGCLTSLHALPHVGNIVGGSVLLDSKAFLNPHCSNAKNN